MSRVTRPTKPASSQGQEWIGILMNGEGIEAPVELPDSSIRIGS